jgi:hypothetical protein
MFKKTTSSILISMVNVIMISVFTECPPVEAQIQSTLSSSNFGCRQTPQSHLLTLSNRLFQPLDDMETRILIPPNKFGSCSLTLSIQIDNQSDRVIGPVITEIGYRIRHDPNVSSPCLLIDPEAAEPGENVLFGARNIQLPVQGNVASVNNPGHNTYTIMNSAFLPNAGPYFIAPCIRAARPGIVQNPGFVVRSITVGVGRGCLAVHCPIPPD